MESLYKVKYARHIIASLSRVHVVVDFGITVVTKINGTQHLYFRFKYNKFAVHKNNITVSPSLGNGSGNGYVLIIIIFIYGTYPYTAHGSKQFFFFFWWD